MVIFSFALPIHILKYKFLIPAVLYTIWVIFGGCPISKSHNNKNKKEDDEKPVFLFINHMI